jgi:hypothetical protein
LNVDALKQDFSDLNRDSIEYGKGMYCGSEDIPEPAILLKNKWD